MLKKLLITAALLTVLILIGGGLLWMRRLIPEQRTFALFNGSVITFRAATFGTNHTPYPEVRWKKFLPQFFNRWRKSSGQFNSFTTPTPSVVFWFEHAGIRGGGGQDYGCTLVHADGAEIPFGNNRLYAAWTPSNTIVGLPTAYPRREKLLRVRVYNRSTYDTSELLGEFVLRNPQVSRAPIRTAPPLPQTASDGDVTVTLDSLETGARRSQWEKTNVLGEWTRASLRLEEKGKPTLLWGPNTVEATDSLGNVITSQSWMSSVEKRREVLHFQPLLWPNEAYKVRIEISRKNDADFASNELWVIRGIAVPTNGGFTLVKTQWNTGRFTVQFHGLNSASGRPPWENSLSGEPSVSFSVTPELKGNRFHLIRITDENGRKHDVSGFSSSGTNYGFGMRLKGEAKAIDVTIALHRSRFVEFHAQPAKWDGKYLR